MCSTQAGLSLQGITLCQTVNLCVAPTRTYNPKAVLLMQNWKTHLPEFHKAQNTASGEVKFPVCIGGVQT